MVRRTRNAANENSPSDAWDPPPANDAPAAGDEQLPPGVKAFPGAIDGTAGGGAGSAPGPAAGPRAEGTPTDNPPTKPKGPTDGELQTLISEVADKCGKLEAERKRINAAIKEQHERLTAAAGWSQRAVKLVLKLERMEDPDRELFDRSLVKMRRLLGHPVQGDFFQPADQPEAPAEGEEQRAAKA